MRIPVITLDGPSGTGKGTISRLLADRLGWHRLDSGLFYRALGWAAASQGLDVSDEAALLALLADLSVRFAPGDGAFDTTVLVNDQDVTRHLRSPDASRAASQVSVHPAVRQALLARQRDFLQLPGLVTDGRDMGTVVFPDASLKLYLDAAIEIRAKRRFEQLKSQGINASLAGLQAQEAARDTRDKRRSVAPLKPAPDAIYIDTSDLDIPAVLAKITPELERRF